MRLRAALGMAILLLGCGGSHARPPVPAEQAARCARVRRLNPDHYLLAGVSADERAAFSRAAAGGVVAVRVEEEACGSRITPVACSLPGRYQPAVGYSPGRTRARDFADLNLSGIVAQSELPRFFAPDRTLVLDVRSGGEGRLVADPTFVLTPPIDQADLRGPECASATHIVTSLGYGSFRVTYDEDELRGNARVLSGTACQGPTCPEVVRVEIEPISATGCPRTTVRSPSGCVRPIAPIEIPPADRRYAPSGAFDFAQTARCGGAPPSFPTQELAYGRNMYKSGDWKGAVEMFYADAVGRTTSDVDRRQIAAVWLAAALFRLGDVARSNWLFEKIAAQPCHHGARTAWAWLGRAPIFMP